MSVPHPASKLATLSDVPGTELSQLQVTFDSFREFVERYAPWLSDDCIFVETVESVAVGTPVRLEIRVRDRPVLVRALGQVDWVREPEAAAEDGGPSGVAVEVTYLDPASARLIDSIFRLYDSQPSVPRDDGPAFTEPAGDDQADHAAAAVSSSSAGLAQPVQTAEAEGAAAPEPVSVPTLAAPSAVPSPPPSAASPSTAPRTVSSPMPGASIAMSTSGSSFLRRSVLLFLLAIAAGATLFLFLRNRTNAGPPSAGSVTAAPAAQGGAATVESAAETPPAVAENDPAALAREVEKVVESWAAAWSEQRVEDYLAAYAPSYRPPDLDRREWEEQRRIRIAAPASIAVVVKDLDLEIAGPARAVARFQQDYAADSSHLYTQKILELARLPEGWKIVEERSGG